MHRQTKQMLEQGIIEPAKCSGWASPVVMHRKSNGNYRFCIDFRRLNRVTKPDAYPSTFMQDILRKLRQARYISTIDLGSAYHQVPLTKSSRPLTAFTVPGLGLFQFRRMPFGLSNACATFQRLIDKILASALQPSAFAYLDDIVIASRSWEEHKSHLRLVLERLREAGLTINRKKCNFCKPEVRYLGVLVNKNGFRPDPAKIAPIMEYPAPKNLKQLRRYLGMASWTHQEGPEIRVECRARKSSGTT